MAQIPGTSTETGPAPHAVRRPVLAIVVSTVLVPLAFLFALALVFGDHYGGLQVLRLFYAACLFVVLGLCAVIAFALRWRRRPELRGQSVGAQTGLAVFRGLAMLGALALLLLPEVRPPYSSTATVTLVVVGTAAAATTVLVRRRRHPRASTPRMLLSSAGFAVAAVVAAIAAAVLLHNLAGVVDIALGPAGGID